MIVYQGDTRYNKTRFQYSFFKILFYVVLISTIASFVLMMVCGGVGRLMEQQENVVECVRFCMKILLIILVSCGILSIGLGIMVSDGHACPNCKHFFAMYQTGDDVLQRIERKHISSIDVETAYETRYTSRGIETYEVTRYIPRSGEKVTEHYKYYKKCDICGCVVEKEKSSSREEY